MTIDVNNNRRPANNNSLMAKTPNPLNEANLATMKNMSTAAARRKLDSQPITQSVTASQRNNFMLRGKRNAQVEDLPSDISEDEWGEIQKFGQRLHEE